MRHGRNVLRIFLAPAIMAGFALFARGEVRADAPWEGYGMPTYYFPVSGARIDADSKSTLYAVWVQSYSDGAPPDIDFSYRTAGGSWAQSARINDSVGMAGSPDVAIDAAGNAYAVWWDARNRPQGDIYFAYRPAGGSWETNLTVNDVAGVPTADTVPRIGVNHKGNAYAAWLDSRNPVPDVYSSYRPAGGTWGANERVSDAAGVMPGYGVDLAVDDAGNAHAVWTDERNGNPDIYYSRRATEGSWSANVKINDDPNLEGRQDQHGAVITVDGRGNARAAWLDNRNGKPSPEYNLDILFASCPARGGWGANAMVNDDAAVISGSIEMAEDSWGNAWVVWNDFRLRDVTNGRPDLYVSYEPVGDSWQPGTVLASAASHPRYPSLAAGGRGEAFAAWTVSVTSAITTGKAFYEKRQKTLDP